DNSGTVVVTADDGTATATTQFNLVVNNVAPTIALTGNTNVTQCNSYTLNLGSITDPGTDTVSSYSINWGDGNTEPFTGNPANTQQSHTYSTTGNYTITASLTDEDNTY